MKPVTPLQAAIIRNLKPPTPLLTEEAVKTAIVRWRRCHRFQSRQQTGVQRNHPFHSTSIGLVMPSQVGTSCPLSGRARQNSPSTTPPVTVPRKTRPARPLQRHFREKTRPASAKTPKLECFERAGRTFSRSRPHQGRAGRQISRTARTNMVTVKPMTPLLAPKMGPVKPASPLRPKTAPKTPISHPQRRRRFHSHTGTREQRRWQFHSHTGTREQRRRRFHSHTGTREQRRWQFHSHTGTREQRRSRFQTTATPRLQHTRAESVGGTGMKEKTPMPQLLRCTVKHYSPQHTQKGQFSTIVSTHGRFLFQ